MKKVIPFSIAFLLTLTCVVSSWAQNAELKSQVEAFYMKYNAAIASKNIDTVMSYISPDFCAMVSMTKADQLRNFLKSLFDQHEQLRNTITVDQVKEVEGKVQVLGEVNLESKDKDSTQWTPVVKTGFIDILVHDGDSFKVLSSGQIDKDRNKYIQGNTYSDPSMGYSVSAPEKWSIVPFSLSTIQGGIMFMTPDGHAPGFFGYVQIPYNVGAKEAIEGDDAIMKRLMKIFKNEQSGPVTVKGMEGYESLTRYAASESREEITRKRVYLAGGGLLYVFIMETPTKEWDKVSDVLSKIMDTFTLTQEAQKDAAAKLRAKSGTGEIMDRIYTNKELGCQIAAPKGWTLESTPLGQFQVSISLKPAQGKSLVRFLANDTKGMIKLEDVFTQELNGIKSITEKFAQNEETKDIQVGGLTGKTAVFTFSLEGLGTAKRKMVMLMKNNILYMILCDALPPEEFDGLKASFDSIIQSFTVN